MHGWIIDSLEKMIIEKYGKMTYEKVKSLADCDVATGSWVLLELYPDSIILDLIDAASTIVQEDKNVIMEEVGKHFMHQVRRMGYANLLNCHGTTLRSWLENVNLLHDHLQSTMPVEKFLFPVIYCVDNHKSSVGDHDSFIVQYRSPRGPIYAHFLRGIIVDASEYYFNLRISFEKISQQGEEGSEYTSWIIKTESTVPFDGSTAEQAEPSLKTVNNSRCPFSGMKFETSEPPPPPRPSPPSPIPVSFESTSPIGLSSDMMNEVFPFYIKFDKEFNITGMGPQLSTLCLSPNDSIHQMNDYFTIIKPPHTAWNWVELERHLRTPFEISVHRRRHQNHQNHETEISCLELIGGLYLEGDSCGVMLMQPAVYTLDDMVKNGLKWDSAIPRHSLQRRLIMVGEHLKSEAYMNRESQIEAADKKRSLEMKRLFVRYVSHEIRNPLNTVSLGLELIQSLQSFGIDKVLLNALKEAQQEKNSQVAGNIGQAVDALASIFDMTNEVKESCDIAVSILNDLLLYEKIEGGLLALECRPQPAVDLLFDTARVFAIQSRASNIDLKLSYDESKFGTNEQFEPTIMIHVDKPKFTQVIRNLLSNAIKFSPENSQVKLFITTITKTSVEDHDLKRSPSQKYLRVEVHDSGAGISQQNIRKLFGSIVQFDAERLQGGGGSGIGLFISKGIMDLHGGFIGAYSPGIGLGSVFYVEVPILDEYKPVIIKGEDVQPPMFSAWVKGRDKKSLSAMETETEKDEEDNDDNERSRRGGGGGRLVSNKNTTGLESSKIVMQKNASTKELDIATPPQSRSSPTPPKTTPNLRVLLVDDSNATRKMVSRYLKMSKICSMPDEANDGLQAVEKFKTDMALVENDPENHLPYDVILMDHIMPNLEGPAASKQIRDLGYKGLVVGLTGQLQPEDQEHFKSCGANHVLAKPVDLVTLRDLLEGCIKDTK